MSVIQQVASIRLQEAVDAMRNIRSMPASKWQESYHSFREATHGGPLLPSGGRWDSILSAMNTELNLRIAEKMLADSEVQT